MYSEQNSHTAIGTSEERRKETESKTKSKRSENDNTETVHCDDDIVHTIKNLQCGENTQTNNRLWYLHMVHSSTSTASMPFV